MKKSLLLSTLLAGVIAMSCEPNEISFYVEHVKTLPAPPECTNSVSDAFLSSESVDLAFVPGVQNAFLGRNQLVGREDYDNLRAESNGIMVEGYDVSVNLSATNEVVGGSNRYIQEYFIPPQSEGLMFAYTIPPSVSEALADELNCLAFNTTNYPEASMFGGGVRTDDSGRPVPRQLGTVISRVRFFGRTQGGVEVETQAFSFPIQLCCGCSINWTNCDSTCNRYCENVEEVQTCIVGVLDGDSLIDCRSIYTNPEASWTDDCFDGEGNPRPCDCNDCDL